MTPHDEIQQKMEDESQELLSALNRVTLGGFGMEAELFASALGLGTNNYRRGGETDE